MDGTHKVLSVKKSHPRLFRSQMGMIVRTVKYIGNTLFAGHATKKSAHIVVM